MWDTLVIDPMINALLLLYDLLGNNFMLAIAVFTLLIRLLTLPLNLRQQRSMLRTQEMQPKIQEIQKKYKDDQQKMMEEFRKIGYNPADTLTGCLPMLLQLPILFGLYQAIMITLGSTPQSLFELSQRVYEGVNLTDLLPVANKFFWLNLGQPDPWFVLPVLVGASMYLQQKLLTPTPAPSSDGKENPAAAMSRSMQTTMPLMFGFFSLQFPAGLSLYFVLSNVIGIAQGYYTRHVMAAEDGQATAKKAVPLTEPPPSSADKAVQAAPSKGKSKSAASSSKKTQSKQKRRSAKR
jgi:YidC/Oxa1 family membrane protein insertase